MQEIKVHIKASAEQFYDVLCNRTHHIATIAPEIVQSVQIHEGEWGSEGSIISWTYIHDGKVCVSKEVVEGIDKENKKLSLRAIEGDLLKDHKSFKTNVQVIPKEKGSVVQWREEFEKRGNHIPDPTTLPLAIHVINKIDSYLTQDHN